jgi:addiction module HigA family antidote
VASVPIPARFSLKISCKPLGLSANALALALRVPAARIGHILRTEKPCAVSADTAIRLARYFGTIPEFSLARLAPAGGTRGVN